MTDRPIIFSASMVRALLAGRKSQTRQIIKPVPEFCGGGRAHDPQNWNDPEAWGWENYDDGGWDLLSDGYMGRSFYAPRDRLWVREAWRIDAWDWNNAQIAVDYRDGPGQKWLAVDDGDMRVGPLRTAYRADGGFRWLDADTDTFCDTPPWKSPIFMPRRFSRLTLIVTDVRVQRLQEITAEDVTAEGIPFEADALAPYEWSVARFADLWNTIHGPDAWDANPWCAAISFTVHRCNIDKMEEGTWL